MRLNHIYLIQRKDKTGTQFHQVLKQLHSIKIGHLESNFIVRPWNKKNHP